MSNARFISSTVGTERGALFSGRKFLKLLGLKAAGASYWYGKSEAPPAGSRRGSRGFFGEFRILAFLRFEV